MIETHEYSGFWWVPTEDGNPPLDEHLLSGTLTVKGGEVKLEVLGSFGHEELEKSDNWVRVSAWPADQPRIQGLTTKGVHVTLEKCLSLGSHMHFPGIPTTNYHPHLTLMGAWYAKDEEILFDEVAVRTSDLDTWALVSGFSGQMHLEPIEETEHLTAAELEVKFVPPETIEIPLDNGEEASIVFGFTHPGPQRVTTEVTITQRAFLHLRFATPRRPRDVQETVGQLRNFLSLAVGRRQTVLAVEGYHDDLLIGNTTHRQPVQMLWEIPHNPPPPTRRLDPDEMLFTLPQAQPSISDVMKAWFKRQDLFGPVLGRYFGTLYHPHLFLDQRFMGYAQTVETYDRRRRKTKERPSEEHKRLVKAIVEAVPAKHQDWLKQKLAWSNELSLSQRIRDVAAICPEVRKRLIGSDDEVEAFTRLARNTRDYHTHLDRKLEKKAAKGAQLQALMLQFRALIEMALLHELGFPCDSIDEILDRVRRYDEVDHFKTMS
jgi:ApeA N-terminal domain 1